MASEKNRKQLNKLEVFEQVTATLTASACVLANFLHYDQNPGMAISSMGIGIHYFRPVKLPMKFQDGKLVVGKKALAERRRSSEEDPAA